MTAFSLSFVPMESSFAIFLGAFTLVIYMIYKWSLPQPLPGIPYNKEAAKSIFGDIPAFMKFSEETQEKIRWLPLQAKKLKSPIIQVFYQAFF